jgi:hypothetical protein
MRLDPARVFCLFGRRTRVRVWHHVAVLVALRGKVRAYNVHELTTSWSPPTRVTNDHLDY